VGFDQLKARTLVTIFGAPVVVILVLLGKLPLLFLVSLILVVSLYEFYQLAEKKGAFPDRWFSMIAALLILWDMYFYWVEHLLLILTLYLVVISIFQLWQKKGSQIQNLSASLWGVAYLGILLSFFVGIRQLPLQLGQPYKEGGLWVVAILVSIWIGDSIAYFVGSSLGKHKLASRVSPKKTIEGAIGGFIGMMLVAFISRYLFRLSWSLIDTAVIGLICGTIGQISDLVESLFKRDAGVKDTAHILPGHGGFFDRFDVLFLTSPLIFFYLKYLSSYVR